MLSASAVKLLMMSEIKARCRLCRAALSPADLAEHFLNNHRLDYLLLRGQLEDFDRQHGLPSSHIDQPRTNAEEGYTSRYVANRREQQPHEDK